MARVTMKHGAEFDVATPEDVRSAVDTLRVRDSDRRIRATASLALDAAGSGQAEVYIVPPGFEFEVRRVTLDLDTASDPSTGNVALNVGGKTVEYLRSGTRIEYGVPSSPNAVPQVPGVQTWGREQGPYLRNAEAFEVRVRGLTALAHLSVIVEGISRRGRSGQ